MRQKQIAPVDLYGAGCGNEPDLAPEVERFHTLVSIMLSAQTVKNFYVPTKQFRKT
jgi:hypothetical protein